MARLGRRLRRTIQGRVVYDRKPHFFSLADVSRILYSRTKSGYFYQNPDPYNYSAIVSALTVDMKELIERTLRRWEQDKGAPATQVMPLVIEAINNYYTGGGPTAWDFITSLGIF